MSQYKAESSLLVFKLHLISIGNHTDLSAIIPKLYESPCDYIILVIIYNENMATL